MASWPFRRPHNFFLVKKNSRGGGWRERWFRFRSRATEDESTEDGPGEQDLNQIQQVARWCHTPQNLLHVEKRKKKAGGWRSEDRPRSVSSSLDFYKAEDCSRLQRGENLCHPDICPQRWRALRGLLMVMPACERLEALLYHRLAIKCKTGTQQQSKEATALFCASPISPFTFLKFSAADTLVHSTITTKQQFELLMSYSSDPVSVLVELVATVVNSASGKWGLVHSAAKRTHGVLISCSAQYKFLVTLVGGLQPVTK